MISYLRKKKLQIDVFQKSFRSLLENFRFQKKGQNTSDAVLKLAHQLEKGLCISNPRDMWGWEKANQLATLMQGVDSFANRTAKAVLSEYIHRKLHANNSGDVEKAKSFIKKYGSIYSETNENNGGTIELSKSDFVFNVTEIERLFNSRHSVRDFDPSPISVESLNNALELANRCPSACNRQPTKVYVIPTDVWVECTNDPNQVYNSTQHVLITGRRDAYSIDEMYDWIVSASIYASYLSLTLTLYGIGSCVIRKGLLDDKKYMKLKERCGIPDSEKIIIELAIGNLKDSFQVPISNRRDIQDFVKYIM